MTTIRRIIRINGEEYAFEWNETKAIENKKKHGVSFDEAMTVFFDKRAIVSTDDIHSLQEERFVIVGMSSLRNILTVCHCERCPGTVYRLISARKATNSEMDNYFMGGDIS